MRCSRVVVCMMVLLTGLVSNAPVGMAQSQAGWRQVRRFDDAVRTVALSSFSTAATAVATSNRGIFVGSGGDFKAGPAFMADFDFRTVAFVSPRVLWAGTADDGLWSTSDGGVTWSRLIALPCTSIARIYPDPSDPGSAYVASLCSGLFLSKDLGVTFTKITRGITSVHTTAVVRVDAKTVAVGTVDAGLFLSLDNGQSFSAITSPLTSIDALAYVSTRKSLVAVSNTMIIASADLGKTWSSCPLPGSMPVRNLAVAGSTLFAASATGGVYGSRDAGITWYPLNQGLEDRSMTDVVAAGMSVVTSSTGGEVSRLDVATPYLVVTPADIDMGKIPQNRRLSFSVQVENLGGDTLQAVARDLPGYIVSDRAFVSTTSRSSVTLTIDPADLMQKPYQTVIHVASNGGDAYLNVRFEVVPPAPVHLVMAIGSRSVSLDGQMRTIEAPPFIDKTSGRTLVPVRFIAEALGAVVGWDAADRKVSLATAGGAGRLPALIELFIGSRTAQANGRSVTVDVAPLIQAGRTFVPLRFVSESLGATVQWDPIKRQVTVDYGS